MKFRLILANLAALAVAAPLLLLALPASAIAPTIEGGNIYRIKNITEGTDFLDPNNAKACDVVQYKVRIHNGGPDEPLNNVTVQAAFPSGALTQNVSTVTVRASNASPSSTTDTATLNISTPQTLTYVAGSTQLLNGAGGVIGGLPDGITGAGVSIGTVGISLAEERFVQFKMKVNCPQPPPPPPEKPAFKCEKLEVSADNKDRKVTITAFSTSASGGATFRNVVITWGDNSAALTSTNPVGQTHSYTADGTYTITATAHFTVNGQDRTDSGPECTRQVTFKPKQPPHVTPVTPVTPEKPTPPSVTPAGSVSVAGAPTTLVATGPASVAAIFTGTSIAGTLAFRWWMSRRLDQE